jgi:Putative zinc-finger
MNTRVMDHEEATRNLMAERYLLGELTEEERDSYEEHLFSCQDCFEQIKVGTELVSQIRQLGTEELAASASRVAWQQLIRRAFRPSPALAFAAMFLFITAYSAHQAVVIRQMNAPHTVAVFTVPPGARRGGISRVVTAPRKGDFELRVVYQPRPELTAYKARIEDETGKEIATVLMGEPNTEELQIRLNPRLFHNGRYVLLVQAKEQTTGTPSDVGLYPFEFRLQD